MALGKQEGISPHDKGGKWKRDQKRMRAKKMRNEVRKDPESAPVRLGYRGWST